jgi:IS30 family transposase
LIFSCFLADTLSMANGLTVSEMASELGENPDTIKRRLQRKEIKPIAYAGPTALYDPSVIELIRNVPGKGRPRKPKDGEADK